MRELHAGGTQLLAAAGLRAAGTDLEGRPAPAFGRHTSKENYVKDTKHIVALALAGLTAGVSGCGGSSPAAEAPAAEPTADKHGCKTDGEGKHVCGAEMQKGKGGATAPAGAPADEPVPAQ